MFVLLQLCCHFAICSVFLSVDTHRCVYLSAILYGNETWTVKARQVQHLKVFHNHCVQVILEVTRLQQWRCTSMEMWHMYICVCVARARVCVHACVCVWSLLI